MSTNASLKQIWSILSIFTAQWDCNRYSWVWAVLGSKIASTHNLDQLRNLIPRNGYQNQGIPFQRQLHRSRRHANHTLGYLGSSSFMPQTSREYFHISSSTMSVSHQGFMLNNTKYGIVNTYVVHYLLLRVAATKAAPRPDPSSESNRSNL